MPFNRGHESRGGLQIPKHVVLGTRRSRLAIWQTNRIIQAFTVVSQSIECETVPIVTSGDAATGVISTLGMVGVFTREIELALHTGKIDVAVHSLKDLPTAPRDGVRVGAICVREDVRDVLVSGGILFDELPTGARVGTSSPRRVAQLRALRADLRFEPMRGNVETRLEKVRTGQVDATVLAAAGLLRLGLESRITEYFAVDRVMPAPGQGALAVQCRADDVGMLRFLEAIDEPAVRAATEAEREFLSVLEGGCTAPIGAYAHVVGDDLHMTGVVVSEDGVKRIAVDARGSVADAKSLGRDAAKQALTRGAKELLRE